MFQIPLGSELKRNVPVIYPDFLVHEDVANAFKTINGMEKATVISAGHTSLTVDECYGRSSTLNIDSREDEDNRIINAYEYCHGIE